MIKNIVLFLESFYDNFVMFWMFIFNLPKMLGIVSYEEIAKQRTGNKFLDHINSILYWLQNFYITVARYTLYHDRPICAKQAWVRSKMEKKVANFFTNNAIAFIYEKGIILPQHATIVPNYYIVRWVLKKILKQWKRAVIIHPDFYLPQYDVYVEVWGMIHDPKYRTTMHAKKRLYKKNKIPLINLYPKDVSSIKRLRNVFFEKLLRLKCQL